MRIFHDLLTLHGYVTEPRLLRELGGTPEAGAAAPSVTDAAPVETPPSPAGRPARPAHPAATGTGPAPVAGFRRGVVTLCATALSAFR